MKKIIITASFLTALAMSAQDTPLWLRNSAISPDGKCIAFTYKGDIYSVSTEGGQARQLTADDAYDTKPLWSPDGSKIAFQSNREGSMDIYVMSANGGTPKRLTTNSANESLRAWSDNSTLLYSASIMPAQNAMQGSFTPQIYSVSAINPGRPEMMMSWPASAITVASAHAFVVDGYQGDGLFHLNWGWGGMSDGYFRLTALDPAAQGIGGSTAGYDREQGAIFNMIPGGTTNVSDAPYVFFMTTGFRSARTTGKLNANVSFLASGGGGIYNCGPNTVEKFKLAVKFVKSTGEIFWFSSESLYGKCAPYSGVTGTFSCYLTDELTDGSYMVSPAVYNPTTGKYYDVKYPVGAGGTFGAEISGNTITFSTAQKSSLSAVEVTIPEVIYQNTPFEIKATLLNPGPEEYYGPVTVKLFKKGTSTEVATLGNVVVSAVPGEPVDVAAYFKLEGTSVAVGEYDLGMIDQYSNEVTERVAVTLEEEMPQGTPTCKSMRATNKAQDQLTFRMNLSCTGGMYINPVYVVLTEYGSNEVLTYFASPTVTLDPNGGIVSVYASCDFHQGTPGARYTAYPYYVYNGNIVQMGGSKISFYLEEPTSGIDNIEGGESAPVEYYDLGGRRVVEPKNGIYIRKQGSEVTKVVL